MNRSAINRKNGVKKRVMVYAFPHVVFTTYIFFNFESKMPLEAGIRKTVAWYLTNRNCTEATNQLQSAG